MSKIPEEIIVEWASKKKYIRDRLNRIKKRLKKYQKQEKHFELRLRLVKEYESKTKKEAINPPAKVGEGQEGLPSNEGKAS